jgi:hypothetical protein
VVGRVVVRGVVGCVVVRGVVGCVVVRGVVGCGVVRGGVVGWRMVVVLGVEDERQRQREDDQRRGRGSRVTGGDQHRALPRRDQRARLTGREAGHILTG